MKKGLVTVIIEALIQNLRMLDKVNNRDQLIRNEICSAINQGLNKNDQIAELKAHFFKQDNHSKSSEILLNTLFKVQNFISNEKL
jgi:hypothetical protein